MSPPALGSTVFYTLTKYNCTTENRRRSDAVSRHQYNRFTGVQTHNGNELVEGDIYPMIVTRVLKKDSDYLVNGQVLLDGNDVIWVSSVEEGTDPGTYSLSDNSEPAEVPVVEEPPEVSAVELVVESKPVEEPVVVPPVKRATATKPPVKRTTAKSTPVKRRT